MNNHDLVKQNEPQSESSAKKENGRPAWLVFLLAVIGLVYLLNPTGGLIELIPDNCGGPKKLDIILAHLRGYLMWFEAATRLVRTQPGSDIPVMNGSVWSYTHLR